MLQSTPKYPPLPRCVQFSVFEGKEGKGISDTIWNQFIKGGINRTDKYYFKALLIKLLHKER